MSRREWGYESCFDIANLRRPAGQQQLIYDSDSRHYSALLKADSVHIARTTSRHTTVVHCISLYNIVMHCVALYYTLLHYLHWIALYCTTLDCIALYNTLDVKLTSVCQCGHLSRKSATNSPPRHKQGKTVKTACFKTIPG